MTVEEMQAQLDKMKDDIEHMKVRVSEYEHMISAIKAQNDAKFERVPDGKPYYTLLAINGAFVDNRTEEGHWQIDDDRFNHNNYFKTPERTQEVADKINFLLKLERLHDTFCPDYVPNWNNSRESKFAVYYNCFRKRYDIQVYNDMRHEQQVYFPTEEIVKKVCDILNKERENNEKSEV